MRLTSWSILGMALGLVGLVFPYAMAAEQASRPLPSAQLMAVEGASSTYHLIDYDGRVVTVDVPSQSIQIYSIAPITQCTPPSHRSIRRPIE